MLGFFYGIASVGNVIHVAGTLTPDVAGDYAYDSMYLGTRAFKLATGSWYLWYTSGTDTWTISAVIGTPGTDYWTKVGNIWGLYTPQGTATGDATVSSK